MRNPPRGESISPTDTASIFRVPPRFDARSAFVTAVCFNDEKDIIPRPWNGPLIGLLGVVHEPRQSKAGTRCFSMVVYEDGAKRGKSGVRLQTAIVLDLDHVADEQLAKAWHWLTGFAGAMYTSFSDRVAGSNDRCARVVILIKRWLSPEEAGEVRDQVVKTIGVPVDENAKDSARIWYKPACPPARLPGAFIVYTAGALLDPDPLLATPRTVAPKKGRIRTPVADWRQIVEKGTSEGNRNHAVTLLAGHLLRKRIDPFVALHLILDWNAMKNSPPLSEHEVVAAVNSIAGRERIRRGGRHGR